MVNIKQILSLYIKINLIIPEAIIIITAKSFGLLNVLHTYYTYPMSVKLVAHPSFHNIFPGNPYRYGFVAYKIKEKHVHIEGTVFVLRNYILYVSKFSCLPISTWILIFYMRNKEKHIRIKSNAVVFKDSSIKIIVNNIHRRKMCKVLQLMHQCFSSILQINVEKLN